MIRKAMPRHFKPEEATAALREIRPLVEALVEHRRAQRRAEAERGELAARIAGNGGAIDSQQLGRLDASLEQTRIAIARCVNRIHGFGAIVKDVDTGLVDFPALWRNEEVLLCWRLGEPEVAHWHGLEEGFAGRKALPFE
jgi:hypothetical protein